MGITRIIYNTFLSYTQVSESQEELARFRLLVFRRDSKRFKITERGRFYLHLVVEIDNILIVNTRSNE